MTVTKDEAQEIFIGLCTLQKKVMQAMRIKQKFDARRAALVTRITQSLDAQNPVDPALLKETLDLYEREYKFYQILEKGIGELEEFESMVDELARQIGLKTTVLASMFMRWDKTSIGSITTVKYAYRITTKYSKAVKNVFPKVYREFLDQLEILQDLERSRGQDPRTWRMFVDSAKREGAQITDFIKSGWTDRMLKLLTDLNPPQAAVLLAWSLNAPGVTRITPIAVPFVGLEMGVAIGVLSEVVKWAISYGYYRYAKNSNRGKLEKQRTSAHPEYGPVPQGQPAWSTHVPIPHPPSFDRQAYRVLDGILQEPMIIPWPIIVHSK